MSKSIRYTLVLSIGLAIGVGLSVGGSVLAERNSPSQQGDSGQALPLDELRTFSEVFGKIKADYVEKVDDKTLLENAIKGMVAGLDPHSAYLSGDDFKELQEGTSGEFGGLGIEVTMEDGFVKVVSPIDDTPAQRAGVKAGDVIIRLDDTPVKGMTLNDAVKVMRGKPGTDIVLTIVREGADKPLKLTLTRAVIKVKSVKYKNLGDGYGYLRITSFQRHTGDDLLTAVDKLREDAGGKLKGLILDLRNNPGGVLGAAVSVADDFLNSGLIVYTEGRVADSELRFTAKPGDIIKGAPMVVLINGGSASASEIVAGALQDHKRAVLMGSRSFGKGSVQTIYPMGANAAVKLTTARYYTPSGRSIQAEGIKPDVVLDGYKLAKANSDGVGMIKEADLTGHLINDKDKGKKGQSAKHKDLESQGAAELIAKDYGVHEALTLLKGLHILQASKR